MKLDRLLAKHELMGRRTARELLQQGRVRVDGERVEDGQFLVPVSADITLDDGTLIRTGKKLLYLMLHKPAGWLSATKDAQHPTVLDLIEHPLKETLHLAGRLDRASSGLVLLTNDGRWSTSMTDPLHKVPKVYLVETAEPIAPEAVQKFAEGFYFHTEDITTLPAELVILGERQARVTLHEGRYHQIKRMFHRVNNRVTNLHRISIGSLTLPADLAPGQWRELTTDERSGVSHGQPLC